VSAPPTLETRLAELARLPDEELDPAATALLLCLAEYPRVSPADYLATIEHMAAQVRNRASTMASTRQAVGMLNDYLFGELGFAGDRAHYYDPANCYLNRVLDRRLGIPVTLSLVYVAVGRRAGLPLEGVNFPGHFLVRCAMGSGYVLVDPFARGAVVDGAELERRLRRLAGHDGLIVSDNRRLLAAAGNRQVLVRVLRNLKSIYMELPDLVRVQRVLDHILILDPDSLPELRERGRLYEVAGQHRAALADYRRFLELAPDSADATELREAVARLKGRAGYLH